jgi:limonene-1,2-epoxide hydrolase
MASASISTITDPGEFVTRFIENIEQSHFTAAMDMVSDDCEYDNVPITKVFGKDAMIAILSEFMAEATKDRMAHSPPSKQR